MFLVFVLRSFGIGLKLSNEELAKVNERQRSVVIEVYGSTTKKEIKDTLITLEQFFDLGINEGGYWNYFHMASKLRMHST